MRPSVRRLVLVLLGLVCVGCPSVPSLASSLFEGDDEGWTVSGNGAETRPQFLAIGGNPGGHLCATDADAELFYFVAPTKYHGRFGQAYGSRFIFDLKTSQAFELTRGRDVIINGGGLSVVQNFSNPPGTDWTPRLGTVRLEAGSGWKVEETQADATEEQLRTVLSNVNSIRIRGDYALSGRETTCLDNVYFGADAR